MSKVPRITSLQFLCNISRNRWRTNTIFCMQIIIRLSYKSILLISVDMARHAEITQNICDIPKFCIWVKVMPTTFFCSQYGIHTKRFRHCINCLCDISLLVLFQVTVGPYKLTFFILKWLRPNISLVFWTLPKFLRRYLGGLSSNFKIEFK